jgi:hypothetical protein
MNAKHCLMEVVCLVHLGRRYETGVVPEVVMSPMPQKAYAPAKLDLRLSQNKNRFVRGFGKTNKHDTKSFFLGHLQRHTSYSVAKTSDDALASSLILRGRSVDDAFKSTSPSSDCGAMGRGRKLTEKAVSNMLCKQRVALKKLSDDESPRRFSS